MVSRTFCLLCWLLFECHLLALHQDIETDIFMLFYMLHPKRNSDIVVVFLIIISCFFMIHDDGIQQKMPHTSSLVLVVVLVELSGMGCGREHGSIMLLEMVAPPLCLVLCPLGHDSGYYCQLLLQPQCICAAACHCMFCTMLLLEIQYLISNTKVLTLNPFLVQ